MKMHTTVYTVQWYEYAEEDDFLVGGPSLCPPGLLLILLLLLLFISRYITPFNSSYLYPDRDILCI